MQNNSHFRQWVNKKWYEFRDEIMDWEGITNPDPKIYFQKNKYFLKYLYKQIKKKDK